MVFDMWGTLATYNADTWARLTLPGSESYNPWWAPFLLTELACNIALTVFWVLLPLLFFRRRSSLPRFYIAVRGASLLVRLLDDLAAAAMSTQNPVGPKEWATHSRRPVVRALVVVLPGVQARWRDGRVSPASSADGRGTGAVRGDRTGRARCVVAARAGPRGRAERVRGL